MALNISAPFIRYPIATSLLMVGLLFIGIVAYPNLPVAPLPQVDFPTLQISAQLPGASPRDDGLRRRSAAGDPIRADFGRLADDLDKLPWGRPRSLIQFDLSRNIDGAAGDVLEAAINSAWRDNCRRTCPARPPSQKGQSGGFAHPASFRQFARPCRSPRSTTRSRPNWFEQISQVPGVAQVTVGGQQKPAIRIRSSIPPSSSPRVFRSRTCARRCR